MTGCWVCGGHDDLITVAYKERPTHPMFDLCRGCYPPLAESLVPVQKEEVNSDR